MQNNAASVANNCASIGNLKALFCHVTLRSTLLCSVCLHQGPSGLTPTAQHHLAHQMQPLTQAASSIEAGLQLAQPCVLYQLSL